MSGEPQLSRDAQFLFFSRTRAQPSRSRTGGVDLQRDGRRGPVADGQLDNVKPVLGRPPVAQAGRRAGTPGTGDGRDARLGIPPDQRRHHKSPDILSPG
jgi:hypothetical protein